ncbi:MAG: MFS transporter [Desulfitobacteriaceae bacterium]|nr:MFS transporter [Desulfitobacteriaceae bacterium]
MNTNALIKRYTLIVVSMASFLTPFMGSAVNLAIPSIGQQFGSSAFLLSWVASSYLLASAAFLVPFGRLADIVGRKKIFILGISVFSISSILCGLAWSIKSLIFFRILQGTGGAMIFGTGMAILTSVFPPQERGKVLGINVATVYTGLSLGPVLGGLMNHNLGWQSIFFLTAIIGIVATVFTLFKLKGEWAGAKGESFDLKGAVLYSAGLITFMYGISAVATVSLAKYLLMLGVVILVVFVYYELKAKTPVLNLSLFKNSIFAFSNLAAFIHYSATSGLGFLLSLYLQLIAGFDSQVAGLILLSQPIMMAVLSPFAGSLSDRIEPRILASSGMGLTAIGLFVFSFISQTTPIWLVIATLAIMGIGFALFSSPNTNAVMSSVEKKFYGIASSTLGTMRLTGQAISMTVVTLIITLIVGNVELTPANAEELVNAMKITFILFTILSIIGIFCSLARGNVQRDKGVS